MDVIILAGGKGNRMEDVLPKPLVKVRDKSILAHQLDYFLKSKLISKIILSLGYKADDIVAYLKVNYPTQNIDFTIETEPLGTAGALKQALLKAATDYAICLNCDDITDIDLNSLGRLTENTICVAHPQLPFGRVKEENGWAVFEEKPMLEDWVSCGWYLFDRVKLLELLPDKGSLEYDVFPKIKLRLYKHQGFWQPLNNKKDLIEFETRQLPNCLI
jgi:NDP-sugar pyrophosphorylase family protein